MKFATCRSDGPPRVGVVLDDRVHPIPDVADMLDLVRAGLPAALRAGERALADGPALPLAGLSLQAPLKPASIRDFVAFEEHVEGVRRSVEGLSGVPDAWYDAPTFYFTNPHTVVGTGADVVCPVATRALDFELEVAVVVGAGGRNLDADRARDHVFGYLVMNDWSARDLQRREMQVNLGPAKGKDFATTLGPWLTTADELAPYRDSDGFLDLRCTVSVNGNQVGSDLLSNMGWTFETMIAYASRDSTVAAGDVLGSGTVGHGGCLSELWGRRGVQEPPPLVPGDEVSMTVEALGTISNRVAVGPAAPALPGVRRRDVAAARSASRLLPRPLIVTGPA